MKVLFVASGNHDAVSPIVANQAEALKAEGVQIEWYMIKGRGLKGYMSNVRPLHQFLCTHKYDVIHAHYSLSAFVASLAGAKPLVVSLMGSDVKAAGWYKFLIRIFADCFHWRTIIVKSKDMYRELGIKRAVIIPNGVNMERFKPMDKEECRQRLGWSSDKKQVLFPANASRPEKDYPMAKAAVERNKNIDLHAFHNTPNDETPYWYNAADIVLMTSKWEGSPNAVKEAMACSRPIVATNVGDIAERVEGVEGCYVAQSRDAGELALLIENALAYGYTHGRERILADGLDAHSVNEKLKSLYEKVSTEEPE